MEQNVVLAKRLKELMEVKGISFGELAQKSGLDARRLHRIANGVVSNPSVFVMMRICNGLEVTLDEFFGTEELKAFAK